MKATITLTDNTTFQEALKVLDTSGLGFLACIDTNDRLVGVLTDGDVRRGILSDNTNLKEIINSSPEVMSIESSTNEIVAKLKKIHRRHMPLVDKDFILRSIFSLDEVEFNSKDNYVVLMAGGLGTRLGELTKDLPKPMLELAGKPIIQHIIELFRDQGFRKFILCVNYKKEIIQEYLKCGEKLGVSIEYVIENKRMGTAGALTLINKKFNESFFLVNADVITNMDFSSLLDFHSDNNSSATMCIRKYEQEIPYGVVNIEHNRIISIQEKPKVSFFINTGIYVLKQSIVHYIPNEQFFDMPDLFKLLEKEDISTFAYKNENYWIDIGQKEQLLQAKSDMECD